MEALMRLGENRLIDLTPLLTHTFTMAQPPEAYNLFSRQLDRVLKVAGAP